MSAIRSLSRVKRTCAGHGRIEAIDPSETSGARICCDAQLGISTVVSPLALLPDLVLADADGRPSEVAEAVLHHGAALPLANLRRAAPPAEQDVNDKQHGQR